MLEATQKMSSSGKDNYVKDDALTTPAPVYKQLSSFSSFILFYLFEKTFTSLCGRTCYSRFIILSC
jgi:hypothetical protein